MRKFHSIAFIAMAICTMSNAQSAAAGQPLRGGTCWANIGLRAAIDSTTQLNCEILGVVTVGEIYEKGFRIVSVLQSSQPPAFLTFIIEEQR